MGLEWHSQDPGVDPKFSTGLKKKYKIHRRDTGFDLYSGELDSSKSWYGMQYWEKTVFGIEMADVRDPLDAVMRS